MKLNKVFNRHFTLLLYIIVLLLGTLYIQHVKFNQIDVKLNLMAPIQLLESSRMEVEKLLDNRNLLGTVFNVIFMSCGIFVAIILGDVVALNQSKNEPLFKKGKRK